MVARVRGQGVGSEQRGQPLGVSDDLQLGDDQAAGLLVELLIGPGRVGGLELGGDAVVLAHEQGLHGGQLDVLVGPDVAGREELILGHDLGVVGHGQGAIGEGGAVIERKQVARTGLEPAADMTAELVRRHRVRPINL